MSTNDGVIVVTGIGGMGAVVARRLGSGSTLVLADVNQAALDDAAASLQTEGHDVVTQVTDVSDQASVAALADVAADLGRIEVVVHTAGVSPALAPVSSILRVDLLGTAWMLDAFAPVIAPGGAGVFIASMAGTMYPADADLERRLARTPAAQLLDLPEVDEQVVTDAGLAYSIAKRANQVRVRAASLAWGRRRARVNSISPGVISTAMTAAELESPTGAIMRQMVEGSPCSRMGTPDDIASAVEFLVSPKSAFVTGTDLLVDGGVMAAILTGDPT